MLREAIERISPLIKPDDIFIITSRQLLEPIRESLPELLPQNVVAEPAKKNTAPCLALAAGFIKERYIEQYNEDEISIAVLTADQRISPNDKFIKTVTTALEYVEKYPMLSTIGITPARPETGYGYIETDSSFSDNDKAEIKLVIEFKEKPDLHTANEYLKKGNYLWNSGMFFWRLDTFKNSMLNSLPEVGNKIDEIAKIYKDKTNIDFECPYQPLNDVFNSFPSVSIDYGLMEKASNVVVTKALFEWDDIGSWDALDRYKEKDEDNNVKIGYSVNTDTKDSIIVNNSKDGKILVSTLGLENMAVVVTDDAILVCPKDKVQDVKKNVEKIKQNGKEEWL
jgi:mannose-1-phosphate guanylyltransferase